MACSRDTDSLCDLMESWNLAEKEKTKSQAQLKDFPHTFQLQEQERLGNVQLERLRAGLESALSVGYETSMETARARNLLAYSLFHLNQPQEAVQLLDLVLGMEDQKKNLVTLANKAVILWHQNHLSEADELVQSLGEMKMNDEDFYYLVVKAKAELAFTYTRLGPSFSPYAITTFEEVIPEAKEPEKWLWKFGLALTKRRFIRANPQRVSVIPSTESETEKRDLLRALLDIAENCQSKNLKAKAYSELTMLLFMVSKTPLKQEFFFRARMNTEQACEKALKLDPEDNSVLCKCGRILRYCKQRERSKDVLEKALTIRESSTAYHHLGITYRSLANCEKYKDAVRVPGYYHQSERDNAGQGRAQNYNSTLRYRGQPQSSRGRSRGGENYNRTRQYFRHISAGRTEIGTAPAYSQPQMESAGAASGTSEVSSLSSNRDVRVMQKMIKSPTGNMTQFTRDDKYIEEALNCFKKAIEFSKEGNTRAIYDLALLQRSLGELEEAKENLQKMLNKQCRLFSVDKVNAFEQMGLIMKEQAESEADKTKKKHLLQNSTAMLQMALTSASEMFSRSPGVQEHLGELCHSFTALLKEVEDSDNNTHWKLQEKARLYQLIGDYKQTLELLQEIEEMGPRKSKDPEYLKLCISNYAATKQFEKALAFTKVLECTPHSKPTMQLFEDKNYFLKIRMHAAREALLNTGPSVAKLHYIHAFQEAADSIQNEDSMSEGEETDCSVDSKSDAETWDVAILHEESKEAWDSAVKLSTVLEGVFGLKVAVTGRDAPPHKLAIEGELRILRKSIVILVIAGGKPSERIRYLIHQFVRRPSTLTLLVDGEHVPDMLKANRSLLCPPELLQRLSTAVSERKADAEADTLCKIFSFLVNVDMTMTEG